MIKQIKDLTLEEIEQRFCNKHSCNGCKLYIGYGLCLHTDVIQRFIPTLMKEIEIEQNKN